MKFEERYELQVPLGETERGTVWSARDRNNGKPVVVSVAEPGGPVASRLEASGAALMRARHGALARVLDAGTNAEGQPFLVTERIEGTTLEARGEGGPPLSLDQLARIGAEVAGALGSLHAVGIVHGDVEPGTILLVEHGPRFSPKLLPPGLDRSLVRRGEIELEAHEPIHSVGFASPEQARGEPPSPGDDLYALAGVLFALATGRAPHRGASVEAIREATRDLAVPRVAHVREELAGPFADTLDRALEAKVEDRYADASALQKALRMATIMVRKPQEVTSAVGPLEIEADSSDAVLAARRAEPTSAPAAKPAPRSIPKPGALPPRAAIPKPRAAEPQDDDDDERSPIVPESPSVDASTPSASEAASDESSKPGPSEGDGGAEAASGEGATVEADDDEFERLSGLFEIASVPPAAPAKPPPPPRAASGKGPTPPSVTAAVDVDDDDGEGEAAGDGVDAPPSVALGAKATEPAAAEPDADVGDEPAVAEPDGEGPDEPIEEAAAPPASTEPEEEASAAGAESADDAASEGPAEASAIDGAEQPDPERASVDVDVAEPTESSEEEDEGLVAVASSDAKVAVAPVGAPLAAADDDPPLAEGVLPARGRSPLIWVGALAAVAALVGLIVFFAGSSEVDPGEQIAAAPAAPAAGSVGEESAAVDPEPTLPATDDEPTLASADADPEEELDAADLDEDAEEEDVAPEEAPAEVVVTIDGLPAGADLTIDGEPAGPRTTFPAREGRRTVVASLDGHRPWRQVVPGDRDVELRAELRPLPAARPRGAARPPRQRPRPRPTKSGGGGRPAVVRDPGF